MNALNFNIKYGLIAGVILIIFKYVTLVSLSDASRAAIFLDYLGIIALAGASYFAVIEKRKVFNHGSITFGEAFLIGLYVSFIAAVMVGAFLYIYTAYIEPGRADALIAKTQTDMLAEKRSDEEIKQTIENIRTYYKPLSQMLMGTAVILYGFITSLVIAVFTKKSTNTSKV